MERSYEVVPNRNGIEQTVLIDGVHAGEVIHDRTGYWAVTPAGDTLAANSHDDALAHLVEVYAHDHGLTGGQK